MNVCYLSSQKRMESMRGGARSASVEELRAPTREMKMSSRGIAAAIPTDEREMGT